MTLPLIVGPDTPAEGCCINCVLVRTDGREQKWHLACSYFALYRHAWPLCLQPRGTRLATVGLRALAFDAVAPAADRVESGVAQLDAQQRAALAEQLGYRCIGAELPENVSLGDVIQSLPKRVSAFAQSLEQRLIFPVMCIGLPVRGHSFCHCWCF